ncbi:MAG: hypothetical protein QOE41_632 [Mycobacterium sp.]|jgi:uncharacterized protein (TIGR03086 family)|nr:hypothetical protein [Mycobacterium sp.]
MWEQSTDAQDLARACQAIGDVTAAVRPDQWQAPTPCTEWNVRDIVNHLVAVNLAFAALIDGGPTPDQGADHLGDDPVGAYQASVGSLLAALAPPGVLERRHPRPSTRCHGRRAPAAAPRRSPRARVGPRPGHRHCCPHT